MAKRKVGDLNDLGLETIVIWGGLAFGVWYVLTNVLNLGGGNDAILSAELALNPSQNPFSYQFQPFLDFYNNNTPVINGSTSNLWQGFLDDINLGSGTPANASPTIEQFFQSIKQSPPTSSPWGYLDVPSLCKKAEQIYSSMQVGWGVTTDQTQAASSVAGFTNQLQVAFIANYLYYNYNVDLLTYIHGSLTQGGLTQANLDQLITAVNSLPVNP